MSYSIGDVLGDRYEVVEVVGAGGMGEVYRARDRVLERDVAIKVLLPHLAQDADLLERFRREARVLARVRHPGIIGVYDLQALDDGRQAIVLEFVPGRPLDAEIAEHAPLPWGRCADIGAQAAGALSAAHAEQIVHRDVKPSNILLEPDGTVRVADFGIARLQGDRTVTRGGESLGTPAFMSPEQVEGRPTTERSDVYSLGAVLYLAATGRPPFETDAGGFAAALAHVNQPVPDPAAVRPDLPPDARQIIMRAMAKDPGDRFATAGAMADALRASAPDGAAGRTGATAGATRIVAATPAGASAHHPPPPAPAQGPPPARGGGRRRAVLLGLGGGAAVVVAVLVGLAVGGVFSGSDGDPMPQAVTDPATTEMTSEMTTVTTGPDPTTEVVTVTERATTQAPPPPPTTDGGPPVVRTSGFSSPTGNLNCNVEGALLTCSRSNDGLNVFIGETGAPDTIFDADRSGGTVVPYESVWEQLPFRCLSETTGITCGSVTSGEGFFLSRDRYEPSS